MPDNRYTLAAATDIITSRTKYHNKPRWTGTWNTSVLVPIYAKSNIRPGDTVKMNISQVIRGQKPIFPVMDDAYISIECFFVKHKHLLSREYMSPSVNDSNRSFKAWIGAQESLLNMPLPDNDIKLPSMYVHSKTHASTPYLVGGLSDCLGYAPVQGASNSLNYYGVNPFKVLSYYAIWNNYFRDPNTQSPVTFSIDAYNRVVVTGADANIPAGGTYHASSLPLAGVCRDHGYFGSCLPWPQRNSDAITLPLGDMAPVYTSETDNPNPKNNPNPNVDAFAMHFRSNVDWLPPTGSFGLAGYQSGNISVLTDEVVTGAVGGQFYSPSNLYADLSTATAATVNQVRYAFATQRWFEQLARSGNRYDELVYGMTGVRQKDSYDDRPEYLGGKKIPMTSSQVNATSGDPSTLNGVGQFGAFMHNSDSDYYFTKSFDDFGTLMIVAFVRVKDTFGQGIEREDRVFSKFDMFWSQFANIGEVAVKQEELYVTGDASQDGIVFGYQEAWADYRLQHDKVTGLIRPGENLGFVTYANNFSSAPTLKGFITGSQVPNVDRTIAMNAASGGFQWYGQFLFDMDFIRQVPMYSIPGYIDHH